MALVLKDRVKETTTTTGTGTVTLAGAVAGFQSFSAIGNGNTTYYCIAGQSGSEWEVGIGTYTSAGTTLSRTTVLASSNAGALVTFSAGTKDVFCTYPSTQAIYEDASGAVTFPGATNYSISAAVTAGTNAQGQGPLTADFNVITTAASNPSGVTLPTATAGRQVFVINNGANPLAVYPASGGQIDTFGTNNPALPACPPNGYLFFIATSATQWNSSLTPYFTGTSLVRFRVGSTDTLSAGASNTYSFGTGNSNNGDMTFGSDATSSYIQSWNSKILYLNSQGNGVRVGSGGLGVGVAVASNAWLSVAAGLASAAPIVLNAGTNLSTPGAGAIEYDGTVFYKTADTTSGRGLTPTTQLFRLAANGANIGPAIANFFGANSAINLAAGGEYEIEAHCYFTKNTAGTVTVTATTSLAPVNLSGVIQAGAVGGGTAVGAANQIALFNSTATAAAFGATASLTTAVNHYMKITLIVEANASASNLRINFTSSAGTVTPLRNSYYKVTKLPAGNTGSFAA